MRIKDSYQTQKEINKSKFITCLKTCRTEEEARQFIEAIRKEYSDATHVCTAYVIGTNRNIQRSSDNGEPSGTAGIPMLEAILKSEITDICACVVRYFGGVKLGASGLIRAYAGSVSDALKEAPKVEDIEVHEYSITYPYELSGTLEAWLRRHTQIVDTQYDEAVHVIFDTTNSNIEMALQDITKGQIKPTFVQTILKEVDIDSTSQ